MKLISKHGLWLGVCFFVVLACEKSVPSERPVMTVAIYTQGDRERGQVLYEKYCLQCHELQIGKNQKGPHLLRVYHAPAGLLTDYRYTENLKNTKLIWTADNLSQYIANPKQFIPETRMRSEPIADVQQRQDIIAYLSTLD